MTVEATDTLLVPLRSWIEEEATKLKFCQSDKQKTKEVTVRITTVAYGIAELLKRVNNGRPSGTNKKSLEEEVQIDNFCVYVGREANSFQHPWDDINGIRMISPGSSVTMLEPSYLSCLFSEEEKEGRMGRCLEVELEQLVVEDPPAQERVVATDDNDTRQCQLFARLLYELFSHQPFPEDDSTLVNGINCSKEPAHKKAKVEHLPSRKELMLSRARGDFDDKADCTQNECAFQVFAQKMQKLDIPMSICLMTQNLLESGLKGHKAGDAYNSMQVVCEDLHLLLLDPERFLFDKENGEHENVDLLYRKQKLYGRDKEESLITDAFCRVSRGKSEAFFIGGFSGSGKSKLVNSLRDRVDAVGGYVLTYKYDDLSKDKPLFGVVTALNELCAVIKSRNTPEGVLAVVNSLKNVFGDDLKVHDKVREASYNLIPACDKDQFHYDLGKLLHLTCQGKEIGDAQFMVVGQINRGLQLIKSHSSLRMEIAELNMKAGNLALDRSDFVTANSCFSVTLSLLPDDHWESMHSFCLSLYYSVAKAAYSSSHLEKAQKALQKVIDESKCLDDKLDALHLLVTVLVERDAQEQAFNTSLEVLVQLGETIPDSFEKRDARAMIKKSCKLLGDVTEEKLSSMKEADKKTEYILMFYSHIADVSYFAKPVIAAYFGCKMMQLSTEKGMSKYSLVSFVMFAAVLCNNKVVKNIEAGCRLGQMAMKVHFERYGSSSDQKTKLCFQYYALVAYYCEPFQRCHDMLKEGVEAGMCCGDIRYSFLNGLNQIRLGFMCGRNLQELRKQIEYYLSLMGKHKENQTKALILMFHETISLLISNSPYTAPTVAVGSIIPPSHHCFHKVLQSFFLSRSERCNHFAEKIIQSPEGGRHNHIFILFYYALNSFKVAEIVHTKKIQAVPDQALCAFREAAQQSKENFQNKIELLEAELHHRDGEHDKAKASYDAAIASARSSKFTHEEGLACEKAALHYKKIGELSNALKYFMKAQECYEKWGSQVKADEIERHIESIQM